MAYENETMGLIFTWVKDVAHRMHPELSVEVFDERAFADATSDEDDNKIFLSVHFKSSNTDTKATVLETSISLLSEKDDFTKALEIIRMVVSEHMLKSLSIGGYSVFSTPYLSEKFVSHEDSYRAEISTEASFVISPGISNPSISADGEDLFVLQSSVGLAGSNDPVVLGTTGTSKSRIAYYTKTLSMKVYADMTSTFVRKCFTIWNLSSNNPAKDGVFNMVIDYGNGITARKRMVLSQLVQQSSIGAVSTVELSFLEADEDVQ